MSHPWYILTVPTRAMGLATVIYEVFFVDKTEPGMLFVGAALMGMGQQIDHILDGFQSREETPAYVANVYKKHHIEDFEFETDWLQFEMDITAALIQAQRRPKPDKLMAVMS